MIQLQIIITILICILSLSMLLFNRLNKPKQYHIVISGMPRTGKTRLYQYCLNRQLPETVKSAQMSQHDGNLDVAPNVDTFLVDLPSDVRLHGKYKYEQITDLIFLYKPTETQQAICILAELMTKLQRKCKVYICAACYDEADYSKRSDFTERLNEEICKLENQKADENVIEQQLMFLRLDLWNEQLLESQILEFFKGKRQKPVKSH